MRIKSSFRQKFIELKHTKQKGIALLQVLLISAIISILALYLTITARQQVSVAQTANDRVLAGLLVRSAESRVLFEMLTKESVESQLYPLPEGYNFYAHPIAIDKHTQVEIQDVAGLLSVRFPDQTLLRRTIQNLGGTADVASTVTDSLLDWQDEDDLKRLNGAEAGDYDIGPRNSAITLKSEVRLVKGVDDQLWRELKPLLTVPRVSYFNPMVAPEPILSAFLNSDVKDILELRKNGALNRGEFSQLTGVYDQEGIILSKSDLFRLNIEVNYGEARMSKKMTVRLRPYAKADGTVVDRIASNW
ncbi:general secretion pathway protein GspK [Shewanella sp. Scap07]|uniref:general secretion pathway protein GspK n=1 Tax=Shewanella sp. Scap07 TaxID=2589987 RepID=UPI0015BC84BC|nr:type II secretion system protein GspK [Shewanella sp. Scap07]QLE86111.1 general secretion pathway protein GspK [Shewanella sp. Scap07]